MFSLEGKSAIITGGGSGIGRAISLIFAKQGAYVHILEFDTESGAAVANEIIASGGQASVHPCNLSDREKVLAIFNGIGRIDILVNNAGISDIGKSESGSANDFERCYNENVEEAYTCLLSVIPIMKENGGGTILNITEIPAIVSSFNKLAYLMSKAAIVAMTTNVANDYIRDNIRCNCVSSARTNTHLLSGVILDSFSGMEGEVFDQLFKSQPIEAMAKPEEVAIIALYLCLDKSIFLTGQVYTVGDRVIELNN